MGKITYDVFKDNLLPSFVFPFCLTSVLIKVNYWGIVSVVCASFLYIVTVIYQRKRCCDGRNLYHC